MGDYIALSKATHNWSYNACYGITHDIPNNIHIYIYIYIYIYIHSFKSYYIYIILIQILEKLENDIACINLHKSQKINIEYSKQLVWKFWIFVSF
jgi:hypothetical protein